MREAADRLDASKASDAYSSELLGHVLARRVASLQDDPRTTLFFGRIDTRTDHGDETFHIGRRHVSDGSGDPVVVDWRAPISTAFYRASPAEPMGVELRRRFGVDRGRLTAYEDERLTRGDTADHSAILAAEIERPRSGPDARHRLDDPARAGRDRPQRPRDEHLRAGRAGHRQDRRGPAPRGLAALLLPLAARPLRRARRRPEPGVPRPHRCRPALARRGARAPRDDRHAPGARPGPRRGPHRRRDPQGRRPPRRGAPPRRVVARRPRRGGARRPARVTPLARAGPRHPRRASPPSSPAACATPPPATCYPSASPTACCSRWSAPATPPTTGSRTPSRAPRPSGPYVRGLWPVLDPAGVALPALLGCRDPRRCGGRHPHRRRAANAAVGQPSSHQGSGPRWTRADMALLDEVADLLGAHPEPRTRRARRGAGPLADAAAGRRPPASTGSLTVLGDIAQGTTPWATESWGDAMSHLGRPAARARRPRPRVPRARPRHRVRRTPAAAHGTGARRAQVGPRQPGTPLRRAHRRGEARGGGHGCRARGRGRARLGRCHRAGCRPRRPGRVPHRGRHPHGRLDADHGDDEDRQVELVPASIAKGLEFDRVVVVEPAAIVDASPTCAPGCGGSTWCSPGRCPS